MTIQDTSKNRTMTLWKCSWMNMIKKSSNLWCDMFRYLVQSRWWNPCVRLPSALQKNPDSNKIPEWVQERSQRARHHLLLKSEGYKDWFGEANPKQPSLRGGRIFFWKLNFRFFENWKPNSRFFKTDNLIPGWRINGSLAGPWSDSSVSALGELHPLGQQKIQNGCTVINLPIWLKNGCH